MIESGYHRPHTRFKMATQMGIGKSSAREAVGHDGYPNFPGEPYIDNAETTVIENDPQRRLPPPKVPKSQHVTSHILSGPSESHTPSSHLMDPPFTRQLIRNLSVSSRLHVAGYSTTCPLKCAQCQWSPNEATLFDKVPRGHRYHRVDKLCLGTEVLSSNGITLSNNDSSGDCRSCKCTVGDSSLNREFGTQPSVAGGPSKGWASVVGLKTGGSGDANRFASYMLVIWLLPLAVSTFLVAALGIPHGARAGALLNSTGEFVVSKPPPRLRTPGQINGAASYEAGGFGDTLQTRRKHCGYYRCFPQLSNPPIHWNSYIDLAPLHA